MIREVLEKMLRVWRNLSEREQRLAVATLLVLMGMALFVVFQRAQNRISELDHEIARLEDDLVSFTRLIAHREMIESQYAAIAAQHSSEWTEAEIHDRLRQEIYRLARMQPAPLDANGIPVPVPGNVGNLVEIPSLGKGQMSEGGQGYREYRINLRIPATNLRNIIEFLERLHNSPQSLRIDALDLNRPPESDIVAASIDISRIVADGATALPVTTAAPAVENLAGRVHLLPEAWHVSEAIIQDAGAEQSIHGGATVRLFAAGSEVYMTHSLPGGGTYEMIADITSSSPEVMIGVGLDANGALLSPMQPMAGDGEEHRYQAQFVLRGDGTPISVRSPWIRANEPGVVLQVSSVFLRAASEMYQ